MRNGNAGSSAARRNRRLYLRLERRERRREISLCRGVFNARRHSPARTGKERSRCDL
jgi:hypothetical protein